jgi:DNA-directed RNA polymerase subunit RPC12/RpoP
MVYVCENCGEIFDAPYVEDLYSEEYGDGSICRCPECGAEEFEKADVCAECGKVIPLDAVVCGECREYAWEQLEQFASQFSREMLGVLDDLLDKHRLTEIGR